MARFIYGRAPVRRRSNRFVPKTKGLATVSGVAVQTLAPYGKTQTGKVIAKGSAIQQLNGYGQTATGKVIVTGRQEP